MSVVRHIDPLWHGSGEGWRATVSNRDDGSIGFGCGGVGDYWLRLIWRGGVGASMAHTPCF